MNVSRPVRTASSTKRRRFSLGLVAVAAVFALAAATAVAAFGMDMQRSGSPSKMVMSPLEMMKRRVTPAQRKAAAEALAARRSLSLSTSIRTLSNPLASVPTTFDPQGTPDYMGGVIPNYANSQLPTLDAKGNPVPGTGIRKFVDSLPGLGYAARNNLGQYLPVAVPDTTTFPGSDYYEIALVQYQEKLGSDIPTTTLRGYVQENTNDATVGRPSYLGPIIVARRDRPVRVKFTNRLSKGKDGDLFIPTDTTAMGAGMGPNGTDMYTQNRATLHLHGGATPWISDGTPHQWTTPAGENTPYPKGVSVSYVPDMWYNAAGSVVPSGSADATNNPGAGSLTFYYTNQQSARLMFYHDHSYGITRLNVYAGEAAGYVLTDDVEKTLTQGGQLGSVTVKPNTLPSVQVPLIIQDKTFVPDDAQLVKTDPTWDKKAWGGPGSLWFPHVYMPNQDPSDVSGANPMGRWDYGPWFWPPLTADAGLAHPPTADGKPSIPNPSLVPEAFMDTPLVNGTAYPYMKVARRAYYFRILNASNDRTLNLSLFYAKSNTPAATDAKGNPKLQTASGEVPMVAAVKRAPTAPKSPIYQLLNLKRRTYYYTASATERNNLLALRPQVWSDQGVAFSYAAKSPSNNAPLYKIYNRKYGSWYYTTSASELAYYRNRPALYTYKGVAWKVSKVWLPSASRVFRFYSPVTHGWLYTASVAKRDSLIAAYRAHKSSFVYKGTAYWLAQTGGPTVSTWPATWPTDGRDGGVPEPNAAGPSWVQVGTEGGILPAPVVIKPQPVGYNYNRRDVVVLNVAEHSLMLGPAERADVVVDFSKVPAGSKLIMYNDAPAPVPAFDPRYDYYTGDPDQTDTGGAPTTKAGYGPNTRTVMQFQVGRATGPGLDLAGLQAAVPEAFKIAQPEPIVPEKAYGGATDNYVRIQDNSLTYTPAGASTPVTMPLEPKAIQELFELDYGRMNATLGVELPFTNFNKQTTIPLGYVDPTTEDLVDSGKMLSAPGKDGTQIWKITHNGVDTHAIHFHLFNVQLINRVGWDGAIRPPDDNELGWKETVRMNPLEDAIVALRPVSPDLPFKLPDSVRPLDPTRAVGSTFQVTNPVDGNKITVTNSLTDYGWEYVWHCHLLGHEENDMMRPLVFRVSPSLPTGFAATPNATAGVDLAWTDTSKLPAATNFVVERADDAGFTTGVVDTPVAAPSAGTTDGSALAGHTYYYRLRAETTVGYSVWTDAVSITLP